jgi:hypothetical protein
MSLLVEAPRVVSGFVSVAESLRTLSTTRMARGGGKKTSAKGIGKGSNRPSVARGMRKSSAKKGYKRKGK